MKKKPKKISKKQNFEDFIHLCRLMTISINSGLGLHQFLNLLLTEAPIFSWSIKLRTTMNLNGQSPTDAFFDLLNSESDPRIHMVRTLIKVTYSCGSTASIHLKSWSQHWDRTTFKISKSHILAYFIDIISVCFLAGCSFNQANEIILNINEPHFNKDPFISEFLKSNPMLEEMKISANWNQDIQAFIMTIKILRTTGGNLAEAFSMLSESILNRA